ncbi:aminodeoxychorismate lyase [Oceanimonas baumannii]|uniref:aminodeoxychorismate lyase n=1 Tax=Oceanimonas baumannii TaxID=129578 RepID=UPI001D186D2F|nr:aminodeoxychorismate lyase [Oceanimonas baumannii]MCC4264730.1 aminodeoxychorismate lyase [Oceanimonas baumannii]
MQQFFGSSDNVTRGWQLGDGHFTTMHVRRGRVRLWPLHKARLSNACHRLHFPEPDWAAIEAALACLPDEGDRVARLTLLRGPGGRGYGIDGCGETVVALNMSPFPAHYAHWREQGIELGECEGRLGSSPMLAGLKTINRLEQVLLKAELERRRLAEGVVLNEAGTVMEAVTANLFWRHGERVFTPELATGGVHGTLRAWVMNELGERVQTVNARPEALHQADEIWLTNALMGLVPVHTFSGRPLAKAFSMTRSLQSSYEQTD